MVSLSRRFILILCIMISAFIYSESFFTPEMYNFLERMDFYNVPGVSVAVVDGSKLAWSANFGHSVTDESLFQAGTISKAVTAIAVLKLVQQGMLDLDTDVNSYLKDWKLGKEIYMKRTKVTLRHLLTHTAGIHSTGLKGYKRGDNVPDLINILNGAGNSSKVSVNYFPGLKFRYSWGGFLVIQKVIEDVTGQSFAEHMVKNILEPIGMINSTFSLNENILGKAISGHDLFGEPITGKWRVYPELAAMGLWTTAEDVAKLCLEISRILTEDYEGIISRESVEIMLDEYKDNWGLGISVKFEGDMLVYRHSGKSAGYTSYFASKPYKGQAIVIMTNGDNAWKLIMELMHSLDNYKDWGL